ncbi:hypothetical protein G6N76_09590 [Rhizobium daejeonense]|uniref:DUF669 domain-containing protein n=1 Tax=Rhizobium daejeonense TaxID=240521 RepID=A0A6M1S6B4_9HYPH|nr:hypothetical protein [Rhizobium daejeonense]NGO63928.1 hypothetical protein [Rhizobium daejeonense]
MAKIGFDYEVDFENTDKQGGGILPNMYAKIWAESIELKETNDSKGHQAEITFEVQEPEAYKGKKFWAYWTIVHADGFNFGQYKYGKPMFDRLARAVDVNVTGDTDTDELLFKPFVVEIEVQEGGPKNDGSGTNYKDKNQIAKFFFEDSAAKEPVPELGLIGDGTAKRPPFGGGKARPAAANDNRPASQAAGRPASAATGGVAKKNPWSK